MNDPLIFVVLKLLLSKVRDIKLKESKHVGRAPLRLLLANDMVFIYVLLILHVIPQKSHTIDESLLYAVQLSLLNQLSPFVDVYNYYIQL